MEDGRWWELRRFYADFYDFQIALLKQFPEEAGNEAKARTIPYMPGPVAHVTDAISAGRKQNLDDYVKKVLALPRHISRSMLVRQLFQPRSTDYEIDPSALGEDYRLSGASQQSSGAIEPPRSASRQSSRGHMNGGMYGAGNSSLRPTHQRGNPSLSASNGLSSQHPPLNRQPSPIAPGSATSNGNVNPTSYNQSTAAALKIKIFFEHEIISIRVPSDITFHALVEKIKERLKVNEDVMVSYKDDASSGQVIELMSDRDLDVAIQRNPKLALVVNYLA